MVNKGQIRKEILNKVGKFYQSVKNPEKFIPGKTFIHYAGRVYDEKEIINLVDASLDFWLTAGRYAEDFENNLAKFLGLNYCLLTNSGSSANLLAITALTSPLLKGRRLRPRDEVITTACAFPTTVNPIIQNGLVPVFVDVDIGTYNIQVDKIKKAISKKTKAIMIAHTLGNPSEIDKILKIAKEFRLWFIEDNCDALGSKYQGRYTGTSSDISTCSFYAAHHITTGEGGAVFTNDHLLRRIIMSLRDWGRDCRCQTGHDNTCGRRFTQKFGRLPFGYDHKYVYSHIGYNLKITDLQAAIGVAQLEKLPEFIEARRKNFNHLYACLKEYEKYIVLPRFLKQSEPAWFGFPILIKDNAPFSRQDIVNYLEEHKIATRMLFGGNLTKQPVYREAKYRVFGSLKNTDTVMHNLFWVGVYPGITKEMLSYIVRAFERYLSKYERRR